jgi:hypothetical protein
MLPTSKSLPENLNQVNTLPELSFQPSPQILDPFRSGTPNLPEGHRFFKDCLRENYARLIEWSVTRKGFSAWFVTQTFKNYESVRSADGLYRRWVNRLTLGFNQSGGQQLRWIRASEWQIREVIHFHSIVQGIGLDSLSRKRWEDRWESLNMNTGFCRIYDAVEKSAPYLAKYCSKRLGGELQRGGTWRGLTVPGSVSCGHSIEHA